jgi:hypothetical protein
MSQSQTDASHAPTPRRQVWVKFGLLLLLLLGYFGYLSWRFDVSTGGVAAILTWSFFVLCTPVADAGFLLDFPLRLIFGIRMVISELAVWAVAGAINITVMMLAPEMYDTTLVTQLLYQVLVTPWPYWAVIVLSAVGTFLSIRFGDELMDVLHHRDRAFFHSHHFKHDIVMFVFFLFVIFGYYRLIASIGLQAAV